MTENLFTKLPVEPQYVTTTVSFDDIIETQTIIVHPPVFDRATYETQITEEDDRNLPRRVLKVTSSA